MLIPTIHALSGLPRSGSTLLANILLQNPNLHCTPTSGLLSMLMLTRQYWDQVPEFKANRDEAKRNNYLSGALYGFFQDVPAPIIFDKSRTWPMQIEMADNILKTQMKMLITVRDMRDVLASFEKLYRDNKGKRPVGGEAQYGDRYATIEGRCELWSSSAGPVGAAYNMIKDCMHRGFTSRMHFVEYEKLTESPAQTLKEIYRFLGAEPFEHDFENVKQIISEDDVWHGWGPDLHTIKPKVKPQESKWPHLLGKRVADKYGNDTTNFWRK